jgi:hypothetical protein
LILGNSEGGGPVPDAAEPRDCGTGLGNARFTYHSQADD